MAHGVNESCHPEGEVVPKHDNSTVSVELAGDDAVFGAVRDVGGDVWVFDNEQRCQSPVLTLVVQDGGNALAVSHNWQNGHVHVVTDVPTSATETRRDLG